MMRKENKIYIVLATSGLERCSLPWLCCNCVALLKKKKKQLHRFSHVRVDQAVVLLHVVNKHTNSSINNYHPIEK